MECFSSGLISSATSSWKSTSSALADWAARRSWREITTSPLTSCARSNKKSNTKIFRKGISTTGRSRHFKQHNAPQKRNPRSLLWRTRVSFLWRVVLLLFHRINPVSKGGEDCVAIGNKLGKKQVRFGISV